MVIVTVRVVFNTANQNGIDHALGHMAIPIDANNTMHPSQIAVSRSARPSEHSINCFKSSRDNAVAYHLGLAKPLAFARAVSSPNRL